MSLVSKVLKLRIAPYILFISFALPYMLLATANVYAPGDTVTVGEFVFNDDFTPTADVCSALVYNPNGTVLAHASTTVEASGWQYYNVTAPGTNGKYPAFIVCGSTASGNLIKSEKTFIVKTPELTNDSIANSVWSNSVRTITSLGAAAADVWNDSYASIRRLTDKILSGGGSLATETFVSSSTNAIITEILTNRTLIQNLNNISAADVWAYGARSLNTDVDLSTASKQAIWDVAASALTTSGSIGKRIADNLDAQISSRGVSNLTAADVWSAATRTLSDYATSSITTAVWSSGSRTLTNYGNDITAADVWNTLSSTLNVSGSIGKQLKDNVNDSITNVIAEVQTNRTLIQALNNISAADVWAHGARTLTGDVSISSASRQAIWDVAASGLSTTGSIGKRIVDNLDVTVSSRGTSNLTAADVWTSATRTLSDYATSTLTAAIWANGSRTLTNYGNDITAADVWNVLSSSLTTTGSIGKQLKDNVDGSISNVVTEIQTNRTLIQNLNNISAADVWAHGARTLTGDVSLSSASRQAIWDVAASGLTTSGSIGKRIADNLDAQVSTRSTLTAADVWTSATRTLSDYATSSLASAVWSNGSRTLTNYGNNITAADVWNVLASSVTTVGSIGKQLKDNVDGSISTVISEIQTNRALIQALNNVSAADVWAYGARTLTGDVSISSASRQAIWDVAASGLSTTGSIGKRIVDNLDAQVSSRSTLTAADVWTSATRTLSDYATSTITAAVWSNAARTLTNYGNDITAADVWNVLTSTLNVSGSIGKQVKDNLNNSISTVISEIQTNRTLIQSLNNISASDVWTYGARSLNTDVDISTASKQAIWDVAASGLTTSGSIGKQIADTLDAQISSRGISNLTAADVWNAATRTLTDYATSSVTAAVWSNAARTLTNYGNDITAADVWNVLSSSLTTPNSIGKQLKDNVDGSISNVVSEIQTNRTLIQALNNISAADVWSYGARTITGDVTIASASRQAIWDVAASSLTTAGSVGKRIADNIDAQISSRGISNLTAADVWSVANRTLTDYATSSVASAVWSNAARTLTNYGNDITAADVWNVLASSVTTVGSIGKQIKDNLNDSISNVIAEVQTNRTLIQALNNITAADIWSYGARSLNTNVDLSNASKQAIWDVAASGLTTSGSIGKRIADNLDATISSRGTSSLTAADVWNAATRTLSDYATSSVAAAIWASGSRTLTSYGNDITAADVWNVLTSSINTTGSVGKLLKDNVNDSISNVIAEIQTNRTLIQNLNNISAADVWAHGARTLTGDVSISSASRQAIWDVAASGLTTSGSIGKRIADNLDAQVSTRSTLTAADVWTSATRTLSDYATSTLTAAIWSAASRTLTNYGNNITAADVWNVLSSSLSTAGTIGAQLSGNVDTTISSRATSTVALTNSNWTVQMSNVERVQTGKVYRTKVFIFNADSEPTAPFSVPTVNLYDEARNLVATNIPMNLVSTGVYEYTYTVSTLAPQGLWETVVSTQVENGKTIQTNDYWEVSGSPAQVIINSVTSPTPADISANITITNEGLTGYEYQYEWCIVDNVNNQCGGGDDIFHSLAAKFINPSESWNTALTGNVTNPGTYYFKLVVYFGTDSSTASRVFTIEGGEGSSGGGNTGGGGGGGGTSGGGGVDGPVVLTGKGCGLTADFNLDCKVDTVDFSIMLAYWKTNPPFKNALVDINKDGKVNAADFSIMLSQWTKKK